MAKFNSNLRCNGIRALIALRRLPVALRRKSGVRAQDQTALLSAGRRGDVLWTYMWPPEHQPLLPKSEFNGEARATLRAQALPVTQPAAGHVRRHRLIHVSPAVVGLQAHGASNGVSQSSLGMILAALAKVRSATDISVGL